MLEEQVRYSRDGYSGDGGWEARGNYDDGNSYARWHYVRGHYSYDGNSNRNSYYMRSEDEMAQTIQEMMQNARSQEDRETIKRFQKIMERNK